MKAIGRRARETIRKYYSRDVNKKKLLRVLASLSTAPMEG
jgi:hypothetical protein